MILVLGDNVGENSGQNNHYYCSSAGIIVENEKLKLTITHQEEIIAQQAKQINQLEEIIALLKRPL